MYIHLYICVCVCVCARRFSGKVSIAAHSLGGVICFDLLANQELVCVCVCACACVPYWRRDSRGLIGS